MRPERNLTMLTDFYEITMANGYFKNDFKDTIAYFDMFFRKVPDGGGFVVMAGVVSAWLMRGVFSLFTGVMCRTSVFIGRQTSAPRSIAIIFLVFSIFGALLAAFSEGIFFTANNITYILTIVFMGEGVRAFFAPYSKSAKAKGSATSLIIAIALLFFIPQILLLILPYYGAFKVISQGKKKRGAGGSK